MKTKISYIATLLALAVFVAQLTLRSQNSASTSSVEAAQPFVFRLAFGVGDKKPAQFDGSVRASAGRIARLDGWRFGPDDSIEGDHGWKLSTVASPEGAEYSLGPIAEKGVVVTAEGAAPDTTFDVETKSGKIFLLRAPGALRRSADARARPRSRGAAAGLADAGQIAGGAGLSRSGSVRRQCLSRLHRVRAQRPVARGLRIE